MLHLIQIGCQMAPQCTLETLNGWFCVLQLAEALRAEPALFGSLVASHPDVFEHRLTVRGCSFHILSCASAGSASGRPLVSQAPAAARRNAAESRSAAAAAA